MRLRRVCVDSLDSLVVFFFPCAQLNQQPFGTEVFAVVDGSFAHEFVQAKLFREFEDVHGVKFVHLDEEVLAEFLGFD